jgi:hypothetical protein
MKNTREIIDRLDDTIISRYLLRNHWNETERLRGGLVRQFISPDNSIGIIIPTTKDFSDYYDVMLNSLHSIAEFSCDSIIGLLNKVLNPPCDILKYRICSDDTNAGFISFTSMENVVKTIKDMLSSTCLDIINPERYHKRLSSTELNDQMANYKFGQTEYGSYILNLICPLNDYQYSLFDENQEELPLSRRINIKMLRDINTIQRSLAEHSNRIIEEIEENEISVNFLKALKDLYEHTNEEGVAFSITANWCPAIPMHEDVVDRVELDNRYVEALENVTETLMPFEEQNVRKTYYGKIIDINAKANLEDRRTFQIKIATIGDDNKELCVSVDLNYSDYHDEAMRAFEGGLNIRVDGALTSSMRKRQMLDASIEIVD